MPIDIQILRLIPASGADLRSINRFCGTNLIPAAEKGYAEAVERLIQADVDVDHVNDLGWSALLAAKILSDGGVPAQFSVKLPLEGGAERTIADRDGQTALDHAKANGYAKMVALHIG